MEKSRFFNEMDASLASIIKKGPSFANLLKSLKKGDLPLVRDYDSQRVINRLNEIKEVLDRIASIILKPHVISVEEEVVLRSEVSPSLDRESFSRTMRDPSLWRSKKGKMEPLNVHAKEKVDSIIVYENKFICLLIKKLEKEVKDIREEGLYVSRPLYQYNASMKLNVSESSFLSDFEPFKGPYELPLSLYNEHSGELEDLCEKVYHKIKSYQGTEFYATVSPYPIEKYVMATNVLVHDPLYNFCYRFYKNNYINGQNDEEVVNTAYYNYCLLTLFKQIADMDRLKIYGKEETPISIDEKGRLRFRHYEFNRGMFRCRISEEEDELAFSIRTFLGEGDEMASYYLLARHNYNRQNEKDINGELKKKLEQEERHYDDAFLMVMDNDLEDYDHVLPLSYYLPTATKIWDTMLTYATLLVRTRAESFSRRCPACGHHIVQANGNKRHCPECGSDYSIMDVKKEKMLWIKDLWRKKYDQ